MAYNSKADIHSIGGDNNGNYEYLKSENGILKVSMAGLDLSNANLTLNNAKEEIAGIYGIDLNKNQDMYVVHDGIFSGFACNFTTGNCTLHITNIDGTLHSISIYDNCTFPIVGAKLSISNEAIDSGFVQIVVTKYM